MAAGALVIVDGAITIEATIAVTDFFIYKNLTILLVISIVIILFMQVCLCICNLN
ncbi:MAG: hypothetical protein QW707_05090 [Candidatus Bathyarchaeia archaeon]